jgi:hypothetical protein
LYFPVCRLQYDGIGNGWKLMFCILRHADEKFDG